MKSIRSIIATVSIMFVLSSMFTVMATATSKQWFPDNGTNCDYQVSATVWYKNNTSIQSNLFNVYRASGFIFAVPYNEPVILYPGYISIKNNTQITWRYSYNEISSTALNRTGAIVIDNQAYTAMYGVYISDSRATCIPMSTDGIIIKKDDFYTFYPSSIFLDYINCTARIGEQVNPWYYVVSNDGNEMVVAYNNTNMVNCSSTTYFADASGRVMKCIISNWVPYPPYYGLINANGASLDFIATTTPSFFDQYGTYIIYSLIGLVGLVIGILIGHAARKRK